MKKIKIINKGIIRIKWHLFIVYWLIRLSENLFSRYFDEYLEVYNDYCKEKYDVKDNTILK